MMKRFHSATTHSDSSMLTEMLLDEMTSTTPCTLVSGGLVPSSGVDSYR